MSGESEPTPADTAGPTPARPSLAGCVQASVFVVLVLTGIGAVLAFLAAVVVVKLGLGGPRLFVGLPLIVVGTFAWALSANAGEGRDALVHGTSIVVGGVLAAAVILLLDLPAPSSLLSHSSEVLDVKAHGDELALTLRTKTELLTMPPFGLLLAQSTVLSCLAVAGSGMVRLVRGWTRWRDVFEEP
jgi:hypothetical protein